MQRFDGPLAFVNFRRDGIPALLKGLESITLLGISTRFMHKITRSSVEKSFPKKRLELLTAHITCKEEISEHRRDPLSALVVIVEVHNLDYEIEERISSLRVSSRKQVVVILSRGVRPEIFERMLGCGKIDMLVVLQEDDPQTLQRSLMDVTEAWQGGPMSIL